MSARQAWVDNYRAHRAADSRWRRMNEQGYDGPVPLFVTAVPNWERYDSTRLWPDRLAVFTHSRFTCDRRLTSECRMRGGPVGRLPS